MPKQTLVLNKFEGGLNNDSDSRDIAENQLSKASGVDVSHLGTITTSMTAVKASNEVITINGTDINDKLDANDMPLDIDGHAPNDGPNAKITPGYGLASFDADFDFDGVENNNTRVVVAAIDDDNKSIIHNWGSHDNVVWNEGGLVGGTHTIQAEKEGQHMDGHADSAIIPKLAHYVVNGQIRLSDGGVSSYNGSDDDNVNKWMGYLPGVTNFSAAGDADYVVSAGWSMQNHEIIAPPVNSGVTYPMQSTSGSFTDQSDSANTNTGLSGQMVTDGRVGLLQCAGASIADLGTGTWDGIYVAYYSYVYYSMDIGQGTESNLTVMNTGLGLLCKDYGSSATAFENNKLGVRVYVNGGVAHDFPGEGTSDPRIVGCRIYVRSFSKSTYSSPYIFEGDYLHLLDVSFKDGVKKYGDANYTPWANLQSSTTGFAASPAETGDDDDSQYFIFDNPPAITYTDINNYKPTDVLHAEHFKAATVVGSQVYIGNVRHDGVNYPDRVMVCPPNKFDVFPSSYFLDIGTNDGDEIIALEAHADRLLVFKKQSLFVVNIGNYNQQYLEGEYPNAGAPCPSAVFKFSQGIVWANEFGCWFFGGKGVANLIDGKIATDNWSAFLGTIPAVGYEPKTQKIIVQKDCSASSTGDCYVYDMKTKSWTFADGMFSDLDTDDARSNFVIANNKLIQWVHDANATQFHRVEGIDSVLPATVASGSYQVNTKDIDFGQPGVRKKIFKVYVTYKSPIWDTSNVQATFSVNGKHNAQKTFSTSEFGSTLSVAKQADGSTANLTNGEINSTATSLTVDYGGAFQVGDIIIVYKDLDGSGGYGPSEREYMYIENVVGNVLTVKRGYNDSAANTRQDNSNIKVAEWDQQEFVPSTAADANNIYSFKLQFLSDGTVPAGFEINDITIVYRGKRVK